MTNKERAFEIALSVSRDVDVSRSVVKKLDKLGLLTPDSPKANDPNSEEWLPGSRTYREAENHESSE